MSLTVRSLSLALALGLCSVGLARAQDQEQQNRGSQVQVPDGTPEEILTYLKTPRRLASAADIEAVVKGTEKVINHPKATEEQKTEARKMAVMTLYRGSMQFGEQLAGKFDEYVAKVMKEHPGSDIAGTAASYRWVKNHIRSEELSKEAVEELWQLAKAHPKNDLVPRLFVAAGDKIKDQKEAVEFLTKAIAVFGADSEGGRQIQGILNNKKIIGSPMEIIGPTLKGESFNISSLKGKVVLVDFWATWCGPCVAELPNVKAVYEKYRDKGFEVVAISLDEERADLEKFVTEQKIPWTQLIFADKKDMGWSNPLARKYGINGIPAMFLIGRDGKVIARDLRGEALEKAVKDAVENSK